MPGKERNAVKLDRLDKLMIDATGFGYYQADDADPNDAVTPYAKARAREDALLEALKDLLWATRLLPSCQIGVVDKCQCDDCASARAQETVREIEGSR